MCLLYYITILLVRGWRARENSLQRSRQAGMERIKIGKIVNAVALRGEVKVYHYSDCKERFSELDHIIVERNSRSREYDIENVRYQKDMVILKLKGVDDRNAAEALKESDVMITEADLKELPEDTFYVRDLIGCRVYDTGGAGGDGTNAGEDAACRVREIGVVTDVLQNTAQDIYQVRTPDGREVLIPAVGDFVKEVNIGTKSIRVTLIPGMIPDMKE